MSNIINFEVHLKESNRQKELQIWNETINSYNTDLKLAGITFDDYVEIYRETKLNSMFQDSQVIDFPGGK